MKLIHFNHISIVKGILLLGSNEKVLGGFLFAHLAPTVRSCSIEESDSLARSGKNVRMCTRYDSQGRVKIKIPSSLLWIIF